MHPLTITDGAENKNIYVMSDKNEKAALTFLATIIVTRKLNVDSWILPSGAWNVVKFLVDKFKHYILNDITYWCMWHVAKYVLIMGLA